jgi:hypothetical protein
MTCYSKQKQMWQTHVWVWHNELQGLCGSIQYAKEASKEDKADDERMVQMTYENSRKQ